MTITLQELANLLQGRLQGDGACVIAGAEIIRDATGTDITLADNPKLLPLLVASRAAAAIVPPTFPATKIPVIQVDDVHASFARVVPLLRPAHQNSRGAIAPTAWVDPTAIIAPTAWIGPEVMIGAGAIIGEHVSLQAGCRIHARAQIMAHSQLGVECELFPNVVLYDNTKLGDRVTIHAGSVLGAYGFGYERREGRHHRSAQLGFVEVANDVEIGACTTIDRGTYGATYIGEGTKIDNQVMIAHNCRIGKHNLICSHVGIAGSASTGDYVVLAGQAGLRDHVHVGDRAVICAQAGVMNDVPAGATLVGSPAIPEREQMHVWAASYKLPEMRKQFKAMQRIVEKLHGPDPELSAGDSGIHSHGSPLAGRIVPADVADAPPPRREAS